MSRLFISYSRNDAAFARRLTLSLQDVGGQVWIDVDDIRSGEDWSDAIQQALDVSDVMVLILSPESMESVNVASEWKYFLDEGKTVIPVLLREAKIHFRLKPLNYIDFHKHDYYTAFAQLRAELERKGVNFAPPDSILQVDKAATSGDSKTFQNLALGVAIAVLALAAVILAAGTLFDFGGDGGGNKLKATDSPPQMGQRLFATHCGACHGASDRASGPARIGMSERAAARIEGMSAADYLRQSILDPSAYVVDGFNDIMPADFGETLSAQELNDIMVYLLTQ
jgi:mono/diheme cytochrome c family protein